VLQYVLGLKRLGHEVYFVEPVAQEAISTSAPYFRSVVSEFGIADTSALLLEGSEETYGPSYAKLREVAGGADLLLNISGVLRDETLREAISVRVYIDVDPVFTQLWHAQNVDVGLAGHTHFVTIGHALTAPDWPLPNAGVSWISTAQPVVLEQWPVARAVPNEALTTVANWRGYGSIRYDGVRYGEKAHSLRNHIALPHLTRTRFVLALTIHPGDDRDLAALERHGWEFADSVAAAGTPSRYRAFIQGSWAEFGIAKSGYVVSECGWFSDRSACYLASGRPVIAQDTGFDRFLPTGAGLFAFRADEDVLDAIEELRQNYEDHALAARALAEEHFDSDKVLSGLLSRLVAPS
jgi:hypothetical protein